MKWYSVKKFSPLFGCLYLVVTKDQDCYTAKPSDPSDLSLWFMDFYCDEIEDIKIQEISDVTHFALIEPVEIDDENKLEPSSIVKLMDNLTPREKEVVNLINGFDGSECMYIDDVADKLGVTNERILKIENRALKVMLNVIRK